MAFYKQENDKKIINLLGIKLKFTDYKSKFKQLEARLNNCEHALWDLSEGGKFIYANGHRFSSRMFQIKMSEMFYNRMGYFPNLQNPRTFNEKINWLKYNYYNPIENYIADKYSAKQYFAEKVGSEYVVPLLGVWDNVNDINFDSLPEQVVFKNTLSGGAVGVKVIKDLSNQNKDRLRAELNRLLYDWNVDTYCNCLVPERRLIQERIIAEQYLDTIDDIPYDFKFFCFHGEPKFLYLSMNHKIAFFDINYQETEFWHYYDKLSTPPHHMPKNFDKMIEISKKLAQDFPFLRVDLYNVDGKIYIGELTFYPTGGLLRFNDIKYDYEIGKMLDLSKIDKKFLTDDIVKTLMVVERNPPI